MMTNGRGLLKGRTRAAAWMAALASVSMLAACASPGGSPGAKGDGERGGPPPRAIAATAAPLSFLVLDSDADGDRRTTREEYEKGLARSWAEADENEDGVVRLIELSQWSAKALGHQNASPGRFAFDQDQNDQIDREEFEAALLKAFDKLDADEDGVLVRAELVSSGWEAAAQRFERRAAPAGPEGGGGQRPRRGP